MKLMFKKFFLVPIVGTIIIFTNISANKSNWAGMNLSAEEIRSSVFFQLQRGGNCIGEFKKLEPILNRFISQKIDVAYLNNFLGKSNKTIQTNDSVEYLYYLTEKMGGYTVSFNTKDANIVSYTIKDISIPKS